VFDIQEWDGLAKIASFHVNGKTMVTPALFPVVDPKQQTAPIAEMKSRFGFDQVISSAYLMSKRLDHTAWTDYPSITEYLQFDGLIMMDSGAYQVMLYGDIELGIEDTIKLQTQVSTDIGVIMDHPIGYEVNYQEAKDRVNQTLSNIEASIPHLANTVTWTLPIQGGKYIDLLRYYLTEIKERGLIDHFGFFALGSVVQVMINQDYTTLVEMIAVARQYLPENRPLHLFGAGHPAVFALATFLGCDTFDSAAYALMAKDNRYMTVEGTYQLENLNELPCHCPVCMAHTAKQLLKMGRDKRQRLLAEHNLYVSSGEIKLIRQHIHDGNLWDLVMKRSNAVPNLALATRRAIELVTEGELKNKYLAGIPVSKDSMPRITRIMDLSKPSVQRVGNLAFRSLFETTAPRLIILAFPGYRSIYNRVPDYQIEDYNTEKYLPCILLPSVGIFSIGASELYPLGQMINEIAIKDLPQQHIIHQLELLQQAGKKITIYYTDAAMAEYFNRILKIHPEIQVKQVPSLVTQLNTVLVSEE